MSQLVPIVNAARGRDLNSAELAHLRQAVGKSLVAASKLLHFVAPERYPIWDGRICRFLHGKAHQGLIQDTAQYVSYHTLCHALARTRGFDSFAEEAKAIAGYAMTPVRVGVAIAGRATQGALAGRKGWCKRILGAE